MTSLLDSIAPPCQAAIFVERDWEEECETALRVHPALTFAGALAVTGLGLVGAVAAITALLAVPFCALMGIL